MSDQLSVRVEEFLRQGSRSVLENNDFLLAVEKRTAQTREASSNQQENGLPYAIQKSAHQLGRSGLSVITTAEDQRTDIRLLAESPADKNLPTVNGLFGRIGSSDERFESINPLARQSLDSPVRPAPKRNLARSGSFSLFGRKPEDEDRAPKATKPSPRRTLVRSASFTLFQTTSRMASGTQAGARRSASFTWLQKTKASADARPKSVRFVLSGASKSGVKAAAGAPVPPRPKSLFRALSIKPTSKRAVGKAAGEE
jgi:hypothetical protein